MRFRVKDRKMIYGTPKGERVELGPGDTVEMAEEEGMKNPNLEPEPKPTPKKTEK